MATMTTTDRRASRRFQLARDLAPLAVYRGQVWTAYPIVLEGFEKRLDSHRPDPFRHQLPDRILDHCRCDTRSQPEAIR